MYKENQSLLSCTYRECFSRYTNGSALRAGPNELCGCLIDHACCDELISKGCILTLAAVKADWLHTADVFRHYYAGVTY